MKNIVKFLGIIAFVAIIGFAFVSCNIEIEDEKEWDNPFGDKVDGNTYVYQKNYSTDANKDGVFTFSKKKVTYNQTYPDQISINGTYYLYTDYVDHLWVKMSFYDGKNIQEGEVKFDSDDPNKDGISLNKGFTGFYKKQ